jgi:hypothetical protein
VKRQTSELLFFLLKVNNVLSLMTGKYYSILEKNQDWDRGKNLEQTLSG